MHTNFVQWLTMFPNCYHVNLIGNKSQWLIVERLVPFLWHICCDHLHLAVRKKKPLALWIYGRISVFYFHSIKPVRIEFRNVTICFFFRQSKMDLMEKKHYTMYRSVYRFVEFLIWKVGFHRLFFSFLNSHTCKHWVDIYSKLQNPENKVISIKHLMAEKLQRNKHHRTFSEEVKAYRLRSIFFFSCL